MSGALGGSDLNARSHAPFPRGQSRPDHHNLVIANRTARRGNVRSTRTCFSADSLGDSAHRKSQYRSATRNPGFRSRRTIPACSHATRYRAPTRIGDTAGGRGARCAEAIHQFNLRALDHCVERCWSLPRIAGTRTCAGARPRKSRREERSGGEAHAAASRIGRRPRTRPQDYERKEDVHPALGLLSRGAQRHPARGRRRRDRRRAAAARASSRRDPAFGPAPVRARLRSAGRDAT